MSIRHGYAPKQATADIDVVFIGAQPVLPAIHPEDHARDMTSWLEVLTSRPAAFHAATAYAQTSAEGVLGSMGVGPIADEKDDAPNGEMARPP